MWGNPMREREILLFSFRKVHSKNNNTFPSKRKTTYNTKTIPHKFALKTMPQYVQLYGFDECWHLEIHATTGSCTFPSVRLSSFRKFFKGCLGNHAQTCLGFHASNLLLYGLYGSVQYDLSQQIILQQIKTENASLGFVPQLSWESLPSCCSLSSLKLSWKISLNLISMCLAYYPMHSFINLKMTFSLQSVFSPSPTLNPKAKIRSFLFQDQGS
jgi:hypothetical protein